MRGDPVLLCPAIANAMIQDFRLAKIFPCRPRKSTCPDGDRSSRTLSGGVPNPNGLGAATEYPMRKRVASHYTDQSHKFALMDFACGNALSTTISTLKDTWALSEAKTRRTE